MEVWSIGNCRCYCGPYYFPQWVKMLLSGWFNVPCELHDIDYRNNAGKLSSDWSFYKRMFKASRFNVFKHVVAFSFYILVFLFGWISYYFGGEKGPEKG